MLEKPAIADAEIVACVQSKFGLSVRELLFLPLGADVHTAVYRVVTKDKKPYFLKLRSGNFKEISVRLPHFLRQQGIAEVIAANQTTTGQLWASLADYRLMLYPFVEGHDAYEVHLTELQWRQFGRALRGVHTAVLPPSLAAHIPRETFTPKWRQIVKTFMQRVQQERFSEEVAAKTAEFLNTKQTEVERLLQRTEELAQILQAQPQEMVLCHADIHAWNVLIGTEGAFFIVDWDDPILAPKERDLMFIGAGIGNIWNTPQEEALFYEGYGQTRINWQAMAYYRCERIIQDIAAFCEQIFLSDDGGQDREQALHYLASNFWPDHTLDIAMRTGQAEPNAGG